jgi:hypothetical protein
MAKYSMASHGIFCHITCVVCFKINNGLLTLNVWVWSIELSKTTSCEDLKAKKNRRMHFIILIFMQPMLKMSRALE